jgi:hypothetical protein
VGRTGVAGKQCGANKCGARKPVGIGATIGAGARHFAMVAVAAGIAVRSAATENGIESSQ